MYTLRRIASVLALLTGCNGTSGVAALAGDASDSGAHCPPNVACDCTYVDGAYYNCGDEGGVPACSASAQSFAACDSVGSHCASCFEGAGGMCSCLDAGGISEGGAWWLCVGTEYPCKGP